MSSAKPKSKNKKPQPASKKPKVILLVLLLMAVMLCAVLWSSLFKSYPIEGKKQMLAIGQGDTYSGFIDRLVKEDKAQFSNCFEAVSKIDDTRHLKSGCI